MYSLYQDHCSSFLRGCVEYRTHETTQARTLSNAKVYLFLIPLVICIAAKLFWVRLPTKETTSAGAAAIGDPCAKQEHLDAKHRENTMKDTAQCLGCGFIKLRSSDILTLHLESPRLCSAAVGRSHRLNGKSRLFPNRTFGV